MGFEEFVRWDKLREVIEEEHIGLGSRVAMRFFVRFLVRLQAHHGFLGRNIAQTFGSMV